MIATTSSHVNTPAFRKACPTAARTLDADARPCKCRACCALLAKAADPREMRVTQLPCKRRVCVDCRPYWCSAWLRNDLDHFAAHADALHVWLGSHAQLRAVTVRCRRARVRFRWVRLNDGTAIVIASGEFPDAEPKEFGWCVESYAVGLGNVADVRNPVGGCRAWRKPKPEKSGAWEAVTAAIGASLEAAVNALVGGGAEVVADRQTSKARSVVVRFGPGLTDAVIDAARLCAVLSIRSAPSVYLRRPPSDRRPKPGAHTPPPSGRSSRENSAHAASYEEPGLFRRAA